MCAYSPIFHAIGKERTAKSAKEIPHLRKTKEAEGCFESAKAAMMPKLAETAMCLAVQTAMANGNVSNDVLDMLMAMGARMGVPPKTLKKIFDVMIMMQSRAA